MKIYKLGQSLLYPNVKVMPYRCPYTSVENTVHSIYIEMSFYIATFLSLLYRSTVSGPPEACDCISLRERSNILSFYKSSLVSLSALYHNLQHGKRQTATFMITSLPLQ